MASPYDAWRNTYGMPGPQDPNRPGEIRASTAPRWEELLRGSDVTAINSNPLVQALQRYTNRAPSGIGEVTRVSPIDGRPVPPEPTVLDNLPPTVQEGIGGLGLLANFLAPGAKLPPMPKGVRVSRDTNAIGQTNYALETDAGQPVGNAYVRDLGDKAQVGRISINPEFQRQGIASALYPQIEKDLGKALVPDATLSPSAYAFWKKHQPEAVANYAQSGNNYVPKDSIAFQTMGGASTPAAGPMADMLEALQKLQQPPKPTGIRAYHGSPHDFDKFDMSKIGTGEGKQAFGHGLYFAESEAVARTYRDSLGNYDDVVKWKGSQPPTAEQKRIIDQLSGFDVGRNRQPDLASVRTDITRAINQERMMEGMPGYDAAYSARRIDGLRKQLEAIDGMKDLIEIRPPGRMYEVNINADPERFLDWDKPLGQQPEAVRDAFKNSRAWQELLADQAAQVERLKSGKSLFAPTPERIAEFSAPLDNDKIGDLMQRLHLQNSSGQLREAGIPGIRYKDALSRGAADGTSNFVVFDDSLIQILRKYGLLPPAAAAGASSMMEQQEPPL